MHSSQTHLQLLFKFRMKILASQKKRERQGGIFHHFGDIRDPFKIFLSRMFDSVAVPRNNSASAWKPANVSLAAARRTSIAPVSKDQTCMAPLLNEGRQLFKKQKHIFFCIKVYQPIPLPLYGTNFTFFRLIAVVQKFAQFLALCLGTR